MDTIPLDTEEPDHYIVIKIFDIVKVGEKSINAYVKYSIETRTNLPYFRSEKSTVERRFSDFLGLREKLAQKHMVDGLIVPPTPEKNAMATFQTKMTKEEDVTSHNDFLERRKCALERFLNRIAQHPVLRTDPDFRDFLELQAELPRSTSTSALSKEGMKRLLGQVTESVAKMGYRMCETDKWFDEKALQLDNLDTQLKKLHTSVGALIHHRKLLTITTGNFARSVAILGNVEEYTPLSFDLSKLATTEEKIEHIYADQVNNDFYLISELLHDYINYIAAIREVFQYRGKVFQNWQQAQQTLARKREQRQRNDLVAGKSDKLSQDIAEYETRVQRGQEEFEKISKNIKKDVEKFELDRVKEFQANMMKYLETLLDAQKRLAECWESFAPASHSEQNDKSSIQKPLPHQSQSPPLQLQHPLPPPPQSQPQQPESQPQQPELQPEPQPQQPESQPLQPESQPQQLESQSQPQEGQPEPELEPQLQPQQPQLQTQPQQQQQERVG